MSWARPADRSAVRRRTGRARPAAGQSRPTGSAVVSYSGVARLYSGGGGDLHRRLRIDLRAIFLAELLRLVHAPVRRGKQFLGVRPVFGIVRFAQAHGDAVSGRHTDGDLFDLGNAVLNGMPVAT